MRYVVDASIVIKWFVPEPDTADALALRERHRLLAPELLVAEFGNVLATKVRIGDFDEARATMAAEALMASTIEWRPIADLLVPALRLANRLQHPAYDCFYLAAARLDDCQMVTADRRFLRAVETYGDVSHRASCLPLADLTAK